MNELIKIEERGGSLVAESRFVAEALGVQHKSLLETIRTHLSVIESEFGRVAFETAPFETAGGVQMGKIVFLSEDQAMFVATLSRNTEQVVRFKAVLVKSFADAKRKRDTKVISRKDMALMIIQAEEENERLMIINQLQEKALVEAAPKVEYHDKVLNAQNTFATTQIAKELGMSAIQLNKELKNRGVHYQVNGQWVLMRKYQDKGYVKTKTYAYIGSSGENKASMNTVWTQEGRQFIHSLFNRELKRNESQALQRAGM